MSAETCGCRRIDDTETRLCATHWDQLQTALNERPCPNFRLADAAMSHLRFEQADQ